MKIKNVLPIVLSALFLAILILALISKNDINNELSDLMKEQFREELDESFPIIVDSLYNYNKYDSAFEITFLEFGATNCSACRKMEKVLDEIRNTHGDRVKVVFVNAMLAENRDMMKYFGVAAIPTQVVLDAGAKEIFRHTGYISASELEKSFVRTN